MESNINLLKPSKTIVFHCSKKVFVHFSCNRTEKRTDRERRGRGSEEGTLPNENASKESVSLNKIMDFFSKEVFVHFFVNGPNSAQTASGEGGGVRGALFQTKMRQNRVSP